MSNARDKANIPSLNFSSTGIDDNATSTAITINSSGNVGIGESNPGNNLVVDGGANTTIRVQNDTPYYGDFQATTTGIQIRTVGSYPLILNTNQTERMRILHTGNVGIGTSSPDNILMVSSDGASASAQPLSIVNPSRYGQVILLELEFGMGRAMILKP
jgi:urocanate hydratase